MDLLQILIITSGWISTAAWSISFYPQVFTNFRRKSVVGLSFDFLALNLTGFLCYSIYNICFYFVPSFQEASVHYDNKTVPVLLNDVGFSVHASIITLVTVIQCFIYERGQQNVSFAVIIFLVVVWTAGIILSILAFLQKLSLIIHAYYFSTVKLVITITKYTPQAWYNYKRKSTIGWSITNILLDFTGGVLSLFQSFLVAYQNNDWLGLLRNYTKLGLGFLSIGYDILFIIQHYYLYTQREDMGLNVSSASVAALCPPDNEDAQEAKESKESDSKNHQVV